MRLNVGGEKVGGRQSPIAFISALVAFGNCTGLPAGVFQSRFNRPEAELEVSECCCSCVFFIHRNLAKVVLNAERWSIE